MSRVNNIIVGSANTSNNLCDNHLLLINIYSCVCNRCIARVNTQHRLALWHDLSHAYAYALNVSLEVTFALIPQLL